VPIVFAAGLAINLPGASYLIALKDIAAGHHSTGLDVFQVLVFNLIMFLFAEVPLLGLILAPERTEALVARVDHWLSANGRRIAMVVATLLGAFLIARGIAHS
jgi:Sap, sulfolipid-1-addressing protein